MKLRRGKGGKQEIESEQMRTNNFFHECLDQQSKTRETGGGGDRTEKWCAFTDEKSEKEQKDNGLVCCFHLCMICEVLCNEQQRNYYLICFCL